MDQTTLTQHRLVSELGVLGPTASDLDAVLAMLARCSRATLFHRFHGFTDGVAYYAALLRDRPVDQTLLGWHGSTCVGVASLGVGATGTIDLAVLVEDAWQRRGIGTRLVDSLLDSARAIGTDTVHADVLGEDLFILRALRRIGPLTVSIEFGTYSIDLDIRRQGSKPPQCNFPVGFETATGGDRCLDPSRAGELGRDREFGRDHDSQREAALGIFGTDVSVHGRHPLVGVGSFGPCHGTPHFWRDRRSTPAAPRGRCGCSLDAEPVVAHLNTRQRWAVASMINQAAKSTS
jgi:GNAT superfamily N-acetyltransferase